MLGSLLEADTREVIKAFGSVHWLLEAPALRILTRRLHEFFLELVGPVLASMTAKRERDAIAAIELLGDIGFQAVIFEFDTDFFKALGKSLKSFSEIGTNYRRKPIANAVAGAVHTIRKECEGTASRKKLKVALAYLDNSTNKTTLATKARTRFSSS